MLPTPRKEKSEKTGRRGDDRESRVRAGMLVVAAQSNRGQNWQPPGVSSVALPASKPASGPNSARKFSREGTGGRRPSQTEADGEDGDDDEDFRTLRKEAKTQGAPLKSAAALSGVAPVGGSKSTVPEAGTTHRPVDPCYFDYHAAYERVKKVADVEQAVAATENRAVNSAEEEMAQFLRAQGLTGPVNAYARAFALQGIEDPIALVTVDDARLALLVKRAEMECSDELVFLDALRAFR